MTSKMDPNLRGELLKSLNAVYDVCPASGGLNTCVPWAWARSMQGR